MPDRDDGDNTPRQQSSYLPNGREIDDGDTAYFERRLARKDCLLPDWDIPDTAYRPVPIVWFTGALFLHLIISSIIIMILPATAAWVPIALASLAGGGVFKWTWDRGMQTAGMGWKVATVIMLSVNLLYVTAVSLSA